MMICWLQRAGPKGVLDAKYEYGVAKAKAKATQNSFTVYNPWPDGQECNKGKGRP